jgi:adenylate cyclase
MMLQFEGYTLDIARNVLRAADREIALRRKSFALLCYLVENADRLVTKEELLKAIWPDVTVSDESLAHCVSEVRRALHDYDQAIIKTVPRRGYRFAAPVTRIPTRDVALTAAEPPPAGLDLSPQAPPFSPLHGGEGREGTRPCIAVLPFTNLGGDPEQDYFSDGMTEDIITELSRFSELMVIARNSSFQYRGRAVDIRQVGQELGAHYVLEGSVRRSGERIRIAAQLIDAVTGVHRWAERYDRKLNDAFEVQDEVARAIVTLLAAHVNRAEIERVLLKPPAAWEAYEYYLRGAEAFFLHTTRRTKVSLYDARRLLEQSLAIDPGYARAAAMLSRTHLHAYMEPFDGDYLSPAALDRALELAETAVHLDEQLPPARAQLGDVLLYKRQHNASIAEFERAFALNPNFIDYRYARVLIYAGEPAKAIQVLEENLRFDPFQPLIWSTSWLGFANFMLRRYGEAVRLLRECASRLPNLQWPHLWLAAAYAQAGQLEEARREAAEVLRINPGFTIESWKPIRLLYKDPMDVEHRTDGLRKAGLPEA